LKKIFPVAALLLVLFTGSSFAAKTSIHYQGGFISMDQEEINVSNIYGIKLTPVDVTIRAKDKEILIPHSIENLSSSTAKVNIEVSVISSKEGWSVELVRDSNGNGKKELSEGQNVPVEQEIAEGATLSFFIKLRRPDKAKAGDIGYAVLKASCLRKDGLEYVGGNGVIYGGEDEVKSKDTIIVE